VVLQEKFAQLSTDFQRLAGEVSTLRSPVAQQFPMEVSELEREVLTLKTQIAAMPGVLDSQIISGFPRIFAEFHKKHFSLL
jgi:hypothetical protein